MCWIVDCFMLEKKHYLSNHNSFTILFQNLIQTSINNCYKRILSSITWNHAIYLSIYLSKTIHLSLSLSLSLSIFLSIYWLIYVYSKSSTNYTTLLWDIYSVKLHPSNRIYVIIKSYFPWDVWKIKMNMNTDFTLLPSWKLDWKLFYYLWHFNTI